MKIVGFKIFVSCVDTFDSYNRNSEAYSAVFFRFCKERRLFLAVVEKSYDLFSTFSGLLIDKLMGKVVLLLVFAYILRIFCVANLLQLSLD